MTQDLYMRLPNYLTHFFRQLSVTQQKDHRYLFQS